MAEIRPFRALYYNPARIQELEKVVTQPYDKISPEMQSRYYDSSSFNLVRLIRGRPHADDNPQDNAYLRAAQHFRQWIEDGILISPAEPAIYPYNQEFEVPGRPGSKKVRRGFIALCRLEDYSAGIVHPHEETLSAPKTDRLQLLNATRAHFGQIFVLYSDPAGLLKPCWRSTRATGRGSKLPTNTGRCIPSGAWLSHAPSSESWLRWRTGSSSSPTATTAMRRRSPIGITAEP